MENKKDFETILGLSLLPLLFLVAWFFSLDGDLDSRVTALSSYWVRHGDEMVKIGLFNLVATVLNILAVAHAFGFGKLGSKIGQFRSDGSRRSVAQKSLVFCVGLTGGVLALIFDWYYGIYSSVFPLPAVIPGWQGTILMSALRANLAAFGSLVAIGCAVVVVVFKNLFRNEMPALPKAKNILILGSKMLDGCEEWIVMGRAGLFGGIMVFAGTGGGKSRSCLGPWMKQAMTNFDPFPSICVIDPKNSFALSGIELVREFKLTDRLIHFTLDGTFRTNPIYRPDMLRNGGFMYVASLIKAATINFMGGESGDQKFWGTKGSILIKNLLVFCAARYDGYFTLKEFYQEMIETSERDFATEIDQLLGSKEFDWEEKRNIEIARDYFDLEFASLDQKIKDSIAQTASSFLAQMREARIERVFCPKKEEINFWGFDEVVDEGKVFVFGIDVPGISGPISVLMKLMYQRSVMERISNRKRLETGRLAFSIFDEYQTFVSLGGGQLEGDEDYAAKRREALGVQIVAAQSHSSLLQATGNEVGTDVLIQNFRTRVVGNTTDIRTINHYKELGGEVDEAIETESYTESGQKPLKSIFGKGLMTSQPSVSQSVNKNYQRKPRITGELLSRLKTFEAIGLVFNGVDSELIEKICLKPSFYPTMRISHKKVIDLARRAALACVAILCLKVQAFPSICSVVKSPHFSMCQEHVRSACTCGYPPHPCSFHTYYIPTTYIEVTTQPRISFFKTLPGAAVQLSSSKESLTAFGGEEMDGHFYHARVLQIPFSRIANSGMPCESSVAEKPCFDAMSEHISETWKSGVADMKQPLFLAWSNNVKACMLKGAAQAAAGMRVAKGYPTSSPVCSYPLEVKQFPPIASEICNGWGPLLPRTGFAESNSIISAALLAAQRIRSVANEVYHSTAIYPDEKWQMIYPRSSVCFREGQTLGFLEAVANANETGRFTTPNQESFLFAIWKRVSCCSEMPSIARAEAAKAAMKAMCAGME